MREAEVTSRRFTGDFAEDDAVGHGVAAGQSGHFAGRVFHDDIVPSLRRAPRCDVMIATYSAKENGTIPRGKWRQGRDSFTQR